MSTIDHYEAIANLFEYPGRQYGERVREVRALLESDYPDAARKLVRFLDLLPESNVIVMQELFIRTFDVQAITTLDVGYVLFGDDYKRGELLANLNREHRLAHNDCGSELGDHLPNLLRLLPKLDDDELVDELVGSILAPALKAMLSEFGAERIEKKNESYKKHYKTIIDTPNVGTEAVTLFQLPLQALSEILETDFEILEELPSVQACDFLGSLSRETEIEKTL